MSRTFPLAVVLIICLLVGLTGCEDARLQPAPVDPLEMTPEEVVEAFYNWLLEYPGNPTGSGAFRDSPYLTQSLIRRVDELVNAPEGMMNADPFLLAQMVPSSFSVEGAGTAESTAQVVFHENFGDLGSVRDLTIDLIREGREWKIDGIHAGSPLTPDGVVQLFYNGYIETVRSGRSPLAERSYRGSPFLAPDFIQKIDALPDTTGPEAIDPFALSVSPPLGCDVYKPVVNGDRASVLVEFYWQAPDEMPASELRKISVQKIDGRWAILGVSNQVFDPVTPDPALSLADDEWQVYRNADYGFELRYPTGWTARAEENRQPFFLELMPADVAGEYIAWTERGVLPERTRPQRLPPFLITIVEGDRETAVESYLWLEAERPAEFNGYPGAVRRGRSGGEVAYIQHPNRPDAWLFFFDQVGHDPLRVDQAQAVDGVLERILGSLLFNE